VFWGPSPTAPLYLDGRKVNRQPSGWRHGPFVLVGPDGVGDCDAYVSAMAYKRNVPCDPSCRRLRFRDHPLRNHTGYSRVLTTGAWDERSEGDRNMDSLRAWGVEGMHWRTAGRATLDAMTATLSSTTIADVKGTLRVISSCVVRSRGLSSAHRVGGRPLGQGRCRRSGNWRAACGASSVL